MFTKNQRTGILKLAPKFVIRSRIEAAGSCFTRSMEFAHAASSMADLQLLRWQVRGDPDYNEHWALRLSETEVIDLTRAQVDDKPGATHALTSYPANYRLRGQYAGASLLSKCTLPQPGQRLDLNLVNALHIRWAVCRADVQRMPTWRQPCGWCAGLLHVVHYVGIAMLTQARNRLAERRAALDKKYTGWRDTVN